MTTKLVASREFCVIPVLRRHLMNTDQVLIRLLLHLGAGLQVGRSGQ